MNEYKRRFCNALADALISRVFILENPTQSISEKEFDIKPDPSKQTEYLVSLMAVIGHYVKKYNNSSDPPGPFSSPSTKELVQFEGKIFF